MALSRRLRVLAYHGIEDPASFAAHLDLLVADWHPVSATEVVADFAGEVALPPNAVWITFDDGHRSVVETALPLLSTRDLPATMFVCPALVEQRLPFWWDVVEAASEQPLRTFKAMADADRRTRVAGLWEHLDRPTRTELSGRVATEAELQRWQDAGLSLGNHTLDHPMLDRCDAAEQERQIVEADAWLDAFVGDDRLRLFAYPNGHATPAANELLGTLGYSLAALFDHRANRRPVERVASLQRPPIISRLRMSDTAAPSYLRSVLHGWRPWLSRASEARHRTVRRLVGAR
ncbi:MAG: polysaccharide deacetylase family protein [Acidimicrobiales bacterium]|nr:polysaccharide deacetylase family protein [Acidimicrobiales bacterium]